MRGPQRDWLIFLEAACNFPPVRHHLLSIIESNTKGSGATTQASSRRSQETRSTCTKSAAATSIQPQHRRAHAQPSRKTDSVGSPSSPPHYTSTRTTDIPSLAVSPVLTLPADLETHASKTYHEQQHGSPGNIQGSNAGRMATTIRPHRTPRSIFSRIVLKYRTARYHTRRVLLPRRDIEMMMLENLPIEIIESIVSHLPARDILQLRQTSKAIYDKTNASCARRLYHTISTDLSLNKLHWLSTSLTTNAQICDAIQTIQVCAKNESQGLGHDFYWNRRSRGQHLILPCDGFEALRSLWHPHLRHCKTVRLHVRDRQSETDYPNDQLEPADVLQLLLLLAAEAGIKLDNLEIGSHAQGTHLNAERLPIETLQDANVIDMLANLLSISIKLVYSDELVASGWLSSLFASFKRLKDLILDLDMSWGEIEVTESVISSLNCPELQQLCLCRFKTTLSTLDTFFSYSSQTLTTICLCSVTIVSNASAQYSRWKSWLSSLHHKLPHLTSIKLDLLSTVQIDRGKFHVHFSSLSTFLNLEGPSIEDYMMEPVKDKTFECVVPAACDAELGPLVFEIFSHGWTRADQLVLSGFKYEGTETTRALDFIADHVADMSIL